MLEKSEQSLFNVTQGFIKKRLFHIKEVLNMRYEMIAEMHNNPESLQLGVVNSNYKDFDKKLGGFKPGDMIILAARPSMWKTALMLNMSQRIAEAWKTVAFFSLEMSKEQITDRLICSSMGIDGMKLSKWLLEDEEFIKIWDALEKLSTSSIYIDDASAGGIMEMKSKCRRLKMESWLDMIFIDYLQLMSSEAKHWYGWNRVQEISEISRWIKQLARELNVPIIAWSQLSRAVEARTDKRPVLSDLRESGAIEQDSDVVMMLYREDYYIDMDDDDPNKWMTNVFLRKNRNGATWQVDLKFQKKYVRFVEIDNQHDGLWF